ncbi:MAG: hypothetical protein H6721_03730 [Sandaracinus sp.]|nr:hypothetical protein [Sandaracinus sp.]
MRLLLLAALFSFTATASAQTNEAPEDRRATDQLAAQYFQVGVAAFSEGAFERALQSFRDAYELSGRDVLLYNMGLAADRLQRIEEAKGYYERYLAGVVNPDNGAAVRSRIRIIDEALAQQRQATPTQAEPENPEPVEAAPPTEESNDGPAEATPEPTPNPERSLAGPVTFFALAGAGLVSFGVAGGLALGKKSDLEDSCAPACSAADTEGGRRAALAADVALGVAVAGAIVGTIWWIVGRPSNANDEGVAVAPWIGPNGAGLGVRGAL